MPVAASSTPSLRQASSGWWFRGWASPLITAGLTGRASSAADLISALKLPVVVIEAEQVHGASVAIVERTRQDGRSLAGCDALVTACPGVALLIRTADCLPVFVADPLRRVVGLAHAGWRGLHASLLARLVGAFRHTYHSRPGDLRVAIGPAIRACCYDVGADVAAHFGAFIQRQGARQTCDLIGVAAGQLQSSGVSRKHIWDSGRCTGCETQDWFSLRRQGEGAGRLISLIVLRP